MRCKLIFLILFASLCLVFYSDARAQENFNILPILQYDQNWHSAVMDVAIYDHYAVLACDNEGVRIVDGYDTPSPTVVGHLTGISASHVLVYGHVAYILEVTGILAVVDLTNPAQPQLALEVQGGEWNRLRVLEGRLFVCGDDLTMFDISNPTAPQIVWQRAMQDWQAQDIDIVGNRAYIAAKDVLIWDVSDLNSPQPLDTLHVNVYYEEAIARSVRVRGNYAFVACGTHGFQVVDIAADQIVSETDSLNYAYSLELRGDYACLYYGPFDCPLALINVSNPAVPVVTGIYRPPMYLGGFALQNDRVYVADVWYGLRTVDISNPHNPTEIARYDQCGDYGEVKVVGNRAYVSRSAVSDRGCRIQVLDISDRQHPVELGDLEIAGGPEVTRFNYYLSGTTCFVSRVRGEAHLDAYNLADPASPVLLGTLAGEGYAFRGLLRGNIFYVNEHNGLRIVDVSNPAAMQQVNFWEHDVGNCLMADDGNRLYLAENCGLGLSAVDLTDPVRPVVLQTAMHCSAEGLSAGNGMVCLISHDTLLIYDAVPGDPWEPLSATPLDQTWTDGEHTVAIDGDLVYLTTDESRLLIYDATDRSAPQLVGSYQTPGNASGVVLSSGLAVVAQGSALGLYDCADARLGASGRVPVALSGSVALEPNYPNPFNAVTQIPFELPAQSRVTLTVYDVLGRSVATLASGNYAAGSHVIAWNGNGVASGQYFVRLQTASRCQTRSITLLK
jgi:hypothetical protein